MSLSALNLTIFASRSRDDLTVWMLFLLKLQVSTKTMVTQLQIIIKKPIYIPLVYVYKSNIQRNSNGFSYHFVGL